jgi:hypothetical protein
MRTILAMAVALLLNAQDGATKRDRQGPVTVTVTLAESSASGIKAKVVLDTHSVPLDEIAFDQVVSLRRPDGADIPPVAVEQMTGGGHHRTAVVVFPAADGGTEMRIAVKNVGGVAERVFRWDLPLSR